MAQAPLVTQSKKNQGDLQNVITQMQSEEEQLLEIWVGQSHAGIRYRMLIEYLSTFLSFAILFGVFALLYRQMLKR